MTAAIDITRQWVERTIIGLNLCPFARIPYERGLVRLSLCEGADDAEQMQAFWHEVALLESSPAAELSNTLLIFTHAEKSFESFYEFCGLLEDMLEHSRFGADIQMVVFHPGFYFGDSAPEEAGNLVNRSPFPTIHLLRTQEVAQAAATLATGESIAWKNKQKIEQLAPDQRQIYWWFLGE